MFWVFVCIELAFLGIASGAAAALARTGAPSETAPLAKTTAAEILTEAPVPPDLTVERWFTAWSPIFCGCSWPRSACSSTSHGVLDQYHGIAVVDDHRPDRRLRNLPDQHAPAVARLIESRHTTLPRICRPPSLWRSLPSARVRMKPEASPSVLPEQGEESAGIVIPIIIGAVTVGVGIVSIALMVGQIRKRRARD